MRVSTVALLLALQPQKAASFVGVPGGALRPSPSHVRHDAGTGTGCTATCSRIGADSSSTGPGGGGFGVVGRSATATAAVPGERDLLGDSVFLYVYRVPGMARTPF